MNQIEYIHNTGILQPEELRILFDKNKNFKAFGFKAEEEYGIHCEEGNGCEWYFFQGYKLALYEEMHIRQNKMITDEQGQPFSLFKIITQTIRYLNKELMENLKKKTGQI